MPAGLGGCAHNVTPASGEGAVAIPTSAPALAVEPRFIDLRRRAITTTITRIGNNVFRKSGIHDALPSPEMRSEAGRRPIRRRGLVSQHRLARRQRLVEPAARREDRRGLQALVPRPRPLGDRAQRGDELVEAALDSVSVGSTSIAPWTTSGKYMVIGWKPSSISALATSMRVRGPRRSLCR